MKKITIILLVLLGLTSCNKRTHEDNWGDSQNMHMSDFLQNYDLWYIDIDRTEGTGNIGFMSKAFTISFFTNFEVFANNNMVGLGTTGNGFGINIGTYRVNNISNLLSIDDDIDGFYDFKVVRVSNNVVKLICQSENVSYYLVGYQKNAFDFDALFYDNITYFLQEFETWTKTFSDIVSPSEPFVNENHLTFYVDGDDNIFDSSESPVNIPIGQIDWNYSGSYEVVNTRQNNHKELVLYYDINNSVEKFLLTIIDDQHIRLRNKITDNIYEFEGRGYIQYRPKSKRLKRKLSKRYSLDYKKTQS